MLDIKFIRENQEVVKKAIKDKGLTLDLEKLLKLDEERRKLITETDELNKQRKEFAKERDKEKGKALKEQLGKLEEKLREVEMEYFELMLLVPNIPSPETPVGDARENKEIHKWGKIPSFDSNPKSHIELGKDLDLIDLERGVKASGFRGYYLKNEAVLMQMGVLWYALRKLIAKGFTPMVAPTLLREFALVGSGHFPFGREEVYQIGNPHSLEEKGDKDKNKVFLAGTSEPALLAYYAGEVLDVKILPVKVCAISPCYRSEVASYGRDTKGIYRIHEVLKFEQGGLWRNDP